MGVAAFEVVDALVDVVALDELPVVLVLVICFPPVVRVEICVDLALEVLVCFVERDDVPELLLKDEVDDVVLLLETACTSVEDNSEVAVEAEVERLVLVDEQFPYAD